MYIIAVVKRVGDVWQPALGTPDAPRGPCPWHVRSAWRFGVIICRRKTLNHLHVKMPNPVVRSLGLTARRIVVE